jgi:hypothetical protein
MSLPSPRIDWVFLGPEESDEVRVGDIICADAGGLPAYKVMAVTDGRAWLKGMDDGADRLAPLTDFHWKAL